MDFKKIFFSIIIFVLYSQPVLGANDRALEGNSAFFTAIKVGMTLLGILLLAYATTRLLALAMIPRGKGRTMQVLDTCIIGKDRAIYLVRVGERVLVIGATEGNITPLLELNSQEARDILVQAETEPKGVSFKTLLKGQDERGGDHGK